MESFAKYSCLIMLVVALTEGATFFEKASVDPAHPNKCYSKHYDMHMIIGKSYQIPNVCGSMSCSHSIISFATCGVISAGEGCKVVPGNSKLNYPKCCDQIICDGTGKREISMVL